MTLTDEKTLKNGQGELPFPETDYILNKLAQGEQEFKHSEEDWGKKARTFAMAYQEVLHEGSVLSHLMEDFEQELILICLIEDLWELPYKSIGEDIQITKVYMREHFGREVLKNDIDVVGLLFELLRLKIEVATEIRVDKMGSAEEIVALWKEGQHGEI